MNEEQVITALAALAQTQRLRVFRALVVAGPLGLTPGELATTLEIPASTLSFHLKELMRANLVDVEREGRSLRYRPVFDQMNGLLAYLTDHCCQGQACLPASTLACTLASTAACPPSPTCPSCSTGEPAP